MTRYDLSVRSFKQHATVEELKLSSCVTFTKDGKGPSLPQLQRSGMYSEA